MLNLLGWIIVGLILLAVTLILIGVFHLGNKYLKNWVYEEQEDEDYNEYMIWKKL